jgi:nucleotide-binding universal stress UspA family protein
MEKSKALRVLIALDDSRPAEAAIETVVKFPWPDATRLRGVVALRAGYFDSQSKALNAALEASLQDAAASARTALSTRWSNAEVVAINKAPTDAILGEARELRADVIALGWRGHGTFFRLLAGSVARAVAARAGSSILVVRTAPKTVRRFVVGFDDSPNARRAVNLLSRLRPERGSRAVLVNVMDLIKLPRNASRLPASVRSNLRGDLVALNKERYEQAQRALETAASQLKRTGWTTEEEIRKGPPLEGLLAAAKAHRADILVVGARATSGIERMLLGSVSQGALNSSPKPVLLVR